MNGVQTWGEQIALSLMSMWERFFSFLPALLGAIIVFVLGWIVASVLGKLIAKAIESVKVDEALEKVGFNKRLKEVGISETTSELIGGIVKWFFVLVFLMAATNILGLVQVSDFLNNIILYIPNVVVAVVVLAVAFLVAGFAYNVVKGSTKAAGVMSATLLATISRWAIILFGIFAALIQLGIATSLISTIFIGIIAAISLAAGLAFGLGGKEEAAAVLRKLREEISERR